jgi:hypothetical protein
MTLGIPQLPEDWGNDRVLSFVRYMWSYWTATKPVEVGNTSAKPTKGPAAPSMVAAAAKKAFSSLSHSDDAKILFQSVHHSQVDDDNPIVAPDTTILVRSNSGKNLQMPCWENQIETATPEPELAYTHESWESDTDSFDRSSYTCSSESLHNIIVPSVDHERRNKNLGWLRSHLQSLNEVANLAFNNADLWQLHQYFFSPAYTAEDDLDNDPSEDHDEEKDGSCGSADTTPRTPVPSEVGNTEEGRAISFKTLGKAVARAADEVKRPKKRGSLEEELKYHEQPCAKRPKQLKPRIAYYPRVREKLESLGTKPSAQTLCLLRQLKYVESIMLRGKNVYAQRETEENECPNTTDVEMILLDLL